MTINGYRASFVTQEDLRVRHTVGDQSDKYAAKQICITGITSMPDCPVDIVLTINEARTLRRALNGLLSEIGG